MTPDDPLRGWPIDLKKLYGWLGWRRRARFQLRELLFESPDAGECLLLYHVGEIGVNKEVGRLAAFKDKAEPTLVHCAGSRLFWWSGEDSVQWSPDGRLAFLYECAPAGRWFERERWSILLHALDLAGARRFRWELPLEDLHEVRPCEGGVMVGPHRLALADARWTGF